MADKIDLGAQLHHIVSIMSHESDQLLLEQLGIGLAQYKILRVVNDRPHARQRTIAGELGQTEASISRQVKLLHAKGMITTRINPKNQREHLTNLTEKGLRTIIAADTVISKYHASLIASLTPKQSDQLRELLSQIHAQICTQTAHVV